MKWLLQYIAEIKRYLPKESRDDIGDELQSLLSEKISSREEEIHRELTEEEMILLIKNNGHPLKVASAYQESGALISEELFPLYKLVMKNFLLALVAVYFICNFLALVVNIDEFNFGRISDAISNVAFTWVVIITVGFHLGDNYLVKQNYFQTWNPRTLPPSDSEKESLVNTIFVFICLIAWFSLLSLIPMEHSTDVLLGVTVDRAVTFVLWLKIQALILVPVYLLLLFKPYLTNGKRAVIMLSDLALILGLGICLSIDPIEFQAQYEKFSSYTQLGALSTGILSFWLIGIMVDFFYQGYKIVK